MDTVAEIETLKSTLDALELQAVRELDATGAVKAVGRASTQDFVTSIAGGHHHRLIHAGPWQIRRTGPNKFAFEPPPGVRRTMQESRRPPDG